MSREKSVNIGMISASSGGSGVLLGANGAVIVKDTVKKTGVFFAIKAVTDVVINTMLCEGRIEGDLNGQTILAGDLVTLYRITEITLTSGVAILYKA